MSHFLVDAFHVVEDVQAIIHDVGPADGLSANIEKLSDDPIAVVAFSCQLTDGSPQALLLTLLACLGHSCQDNDQKQHKNHDSDIKVGLNKNV